MRLKKELNAPRLRAFLAAIERLPVIEYAARAAKIAPSTHYRRYDRDEVYRAAFERAWKRGSGVIRSVAIHRAVKGYQEPVIYKGQYQYTGKGKKKRLVTITKYPERLLMKVLSAEIPDVYNKGRIEHTGPGGGAIPVSVRVEFVRPKEPEA